MMKLSVILLLLSIVISLSIGLDVAEKKKICECKPDVAVCHAKECNDGLCVDSGESAKCYCNPGYQGTFCDQTQSLAIKQRHKRGVIATIAAVISAIAGAVSAGVSVHSATRTSARYQQDGYEVRPKMSIDNFSKWSLSNPDVQLHFGRVALPPTIIAAGKEEAMVAVGRRSCSYGTVSWDVDDEQVVVLWDAVYKPRFSRSNMLAVGVLDGTSHSRSTFGQMRNGHGSFFERATYENRIRMIEHCSSKICVRGTMGNSQTPDIRITVYPRYEEDLARGEVKRRYSEEKEHMTR